jgi:hypothetical protein
MDMTFDEWGEHLKKLSQKVVARWPVSVSVDKATSLHVEIRDATGGRVELDLSRQPGDDCMVPNVRVGSGSGLPSDLSYAQAKLNDMRLVLEALHFCNVSCSNIRVFPEGKCPCAQCRGSGTKFRSDAPCEACNGEGVR